MLQPKTSCVAECEKCCLMAQSRNNEVMIEALRSRLHCRFVIGEISFWLFLNNSPRSHISSQPVCRWQRAFKGLINSGELAASFPLRSLNWEVWQGGCAPLPTDSLCGPCWEAAGARTHAGARSHAAPLRFYPEKSPHFASRIL